MLNVLCVEARWLEKRQEKAQKHCQGELVDFDLHTKYMPSITMSICLVMSVDGGSGIYDAVV